MQCISTLHTCHNVFIYSIPHAICLKCTILLYFHGINNSGCKKKKHFSSQYKINKEPKFKAIRYI